MKERVSGVRRSFPKYQPTTNMRHQAIHTAYKLDRSAHPRCQSMALFPQLSNEESHRASCSSTGESLFVLRTRHCWSNWVREKCLYCTNRHFGLCVPEAKARHKWHKSPKKKHDRTMSLGRGLQCGRLPQKQCQAHSHLSASNGTLPAELVLPKAN